MCSLLNIVCLDIDARVGETKAIGFGSRSPTTTNLTVQPSLIYRCIVSLHSFYLHRRVWVKMAWSIVLITLRYRKWQSAVVDTVAGEGHSFANWDTRGSHVGGLANSLELEQPMKETLRKLGKQMFL